MTTDDRDARRCCDDHAAIHRTVLNYCRAVDRLDFDAIRAVYADDGVDHHTGFSGPADEYVEWLRGLLPKLDGTMHLIGNHLADVRGDQAVSETYGTAIHWGTPGSDPALNFTSGFRYVDHFIRTTEGWRIRERFAVREWTRDDAGRMRSPEGEGPRGRRDGSDPLLRLTRQVFPT